MESHRQARIQMSENSVFIYFEITFRDLQQRDFPFDIDDTHQTCGNLRDNCRIPSPSDPHVEIDNKHQIQNHIDDHSENQKEQRCSAIS